MSVASSWSNGYCYIPLTPRPSTENITSARSIGYRAAATAVQRAPINHTKPIDERPSHTAPISQLHTPAPSVDINPKAMKLFDDIKHLDFAAYGQVVTFEGVDAETWDSFDREYRESCDYKIEYSADDKIVTCASGVHESFTAIVQPFYKVVSIFSDAFRVEHNRDIQFTSGSKRRSTRIPDFAFATDDVSPKYLLVMECAWSQPWHDVNEKANLFLTRKDVRAVVVICIDVQAGTTGTPSDPPPANYQIASEQDFPSAREPLSNVVFQGKIWARGIKKITVHLYQHEYDTKSYDITPGAHGLEDAQRKIALFLANFLASTLGKERLSKVFTPDDPFFVDWDAFYRAIDRALVADGFQRYKGWACQVADDPDMVKSPPPKKRQASEELDNIPDWFADTKPATKKPKKEEDPSFP